MTKKMLCYVALFFSLAIVSADETLPPSPIKVLTAMASEESVKMGSNFTIRLKYETDGTCLFRAWRLLVYVNDGPTALKNCRKFVFNEIKTDPMCSFYALIPGITWLPESKAASNGELELQINTQDWPIGDYKVYVSAVFVKTDGKKDLSKVSSFLITITE